MGDKPILQIKNISKGFPGVKALNNISLDFYPGEVHVLLGENGAGKSTIIKIISGVYLKDQGKVIYKGKDIEFNNPKQALNAGISVIHQELSAVPDLTVAENIFLGKEIYIGNLGFIDKRSMNKKTTEILESLDIKIKPDEIVGELSTAEKQMVEIAKAISRDASIVIMDEPTSSISEHEVKCLFKIINKLKKEGVTIIYISHRLKELYEIGDKISILRDGSLIKTLDVKDTTEDQLISLMVGREIKNYFSKNGHIINQIVLELKGLTKNNSYKNISFYLKKGEILGIAGLIGAGRTEVLEGIFGLEKYDSGDIFLNGQKVNFITPKDAINNKIGFVPEDRRLKGILVEKDVKENISLPSIMRTSINGFINKKWGEETANKYVEKLNIKTPSINTKTKNLSGGNQQKVVLAKWLAANSKILLLDEPTRGIDVNAKAEIYNLINKYTEEGGSVLLVSSDLPEILGICDRIIVMRLGEITGILENIKLEEENIMKLASINQ